MAVNKNSTGYTFGFAILLVVVCGVILASLAKILKDKQQANIANEKRQFILSAAGYASMDTLKTYEMSEIEELFNKTIQQNVYDFNGKPIAGVEAFSIDIVKEYKATKDSPKTRKYPVFSYKNENDEKYIIPMAGNGLWGPIWGFCALGKDKNTIEGIVFDHKSETPGLGAKIAEKPFQDLFTLTPKMVMKGEKYMGLKVVKGGLKDPDHQIDAIAGATITSNGVGAMMKTAFLPYMKAWKKVNN
ncbi:MAG: NADH:ubiquinone reductase (Na(+)-transporting) subunit C [Flavobacteriales bacterium]|nr:NADH:ubiquinone reductase (Na(+)-transporting) subunit C [Flavobacteriales bacterium]|tara:strand:- start:3570 stop:4304 length:735 start_codon:yes stop_codon:yes gene_type:complete